MLPEKFSSKYIVPEKSDRNNDILYVIKKFTNARCLVYKRKKDVSFEKVIALLRDIQKEHIHELDDICIEGDNIFYSEVYADKHSFKGMLDKSDTPMKKIELIKLFAQGICHLKDYKLYSNKENLFDHVSYEPNMKKVLFSYSNLTYDGQKNEKRYEKEVVHQLVTTLKKALHSSSSRNKLASDQEQIGSSYSNNLQYIYSRAENKGGPLYDLHGFAQDLEYITNQQELNVKRKRGVSSSLLYVGGIALGVAFAASLWVPGIIRNKEVYHNKKFVAKQNAENRIKLVETARESNLENTFLAFKVKLYEEEREEIEYLEENLQKYEALVKEFHAENTLESLISYHIERCKIYSNLIESKDVLKSSQRYVDNFEESLGFLVTNRKLLTTQEDISQIIDFCTLSLKYNKFDMYDIFAINSEEKKLYHLYQQLKKKSKYGNKKIDEEIMNVQIDRKQFTSEEWYASHNEVTGDILMLIIDGLIEEAHMDMRHFLLRQPLNFHKVLSEGMNQYDRHVSHYFEEVSKYNVEYILMYFEAAFRKNKKADQLQYMSYRPRRNKSIQNKEENNFYKLYEKMKLDDFNSVLSTYTLLHDAKNDLMIKLEQKQVDEVDYYHSLGVLYYDTIRRHFEIVNGLYDSAIKERLHIDTEKKRQISVNYPLNTHLYIANEFGPIIRNNTDYSYYYDLVMRISNRQFGPELLFRMGPMHIPDISKKYLKEFLLNTRYI